MITKERIDELISQKAKIWGIGKQGNVFCIGLKFTPQTLNNKKWLENKYKVYSKFFETKEEAKWYKEFGCIERIEKLYLPPFEEVFNDLQGRIGEFVIADPSEFSFAIKKSFTDQILLKTMYEKYNWNFTKENYTLACRKAKELFLG